MQLVPAIDLRGGACVRLKQGDFGRETRYDVDPVELARTYRTLGAEWLHVVDLDGAAAGAPMQLPTVAQLAPASGLRVQFGGGIRDRDSLSAALAVVDRVFIGSLAVTRPNDVAQWLTEFGGDRLGLALDVRLGENGDPYLATHAWRETSRATLWEALDRYRDAGLAHVLCTDVERDGALAGPNLELYRECVRRCPTVTWQASGGVRDARDLAALAETGVMCAISGKALLEGRLPLMEIRPFLPNA